MDQKYEQFVDNGTKILLELFSMPGVEDGERQAVSTAWTGYLACSIAKRADMSDPAYIVSVASISYIDKKLTEYMTTQSRSGEDYDAAISLCNRQSKFLTLFSKNRWKLPVMENTEPAACKEKLLNWRDSDERTARILRLDSDISAAVTTAERELTQLACDHIAALVDQLQTELAMCRQKDDSIPRIRNHDIAAIHTIIGSLRKTAQEKEHTYAALEEIDSKLKALETAATVREDQLCEAIILCQQAQQLLLRCQNSQWPLPEIRINTLSKIKACYFIFVEKMIATHKILDNEEIQSIRAAFSQRLESRILDSDSISDPDLTLHSVSAIYLDNKLISIMSRRSLAKKDYEVALSFCNRLDNILQIFRQRDWTFPKLENSNPASCEAQILQRRDAEERISRMGRLDQEIDKAFSVAEQELTQEKCDAVLVLLDDMQHELDACKKANTPVPQLKNRDIKALHERLAGLRNKVEQKKQLYLDITDLDAQIYALDQLRPIAAEQWNEIISLCKQLNRLMSDCQKKNWQVPALKVVNPDDIQRKYLHYLEMQTTDSDISACSGYLENNKLFKPYLNYCTKQLQNISYCIKFKWPLPPLQNPSPDLLIQKAKKAMASKEQMKKIKMGLILAGVALMAVFVLICFAVSKSREGKIEVPFSSSYVVSKNYLDIQEELEDAGFTDILLVESKDGWLEDGAVLSVTIDNTDKYTKGAYRDPDVAIVITYSSSGRIDVSDLLANWQSLPYSDIVARLKDAGFTNITTNAKTTYEAKKHTLIDSVRLNNDVYTNGHAYLPADAPVDITYLDLKIFVSDTNTSFIGRNYEDVVSSLKEDGFTNIQTEEIKTGWAQGNSVISVAINNQTNYDGDDEFSPDVKIVVKFSSNDRVNMTSILSNWNGQDYAMLETSLRFSGFTNLSFKTTATTSKENNQKVAGITINGEVYVGGECHIQKTAPIEITIYVLQITLGRSADDIEDDYYTDIVAWLRSLGFTNITLKRTNDLVTGWVNSEGSIKSISVNGNDDFGETAAFDYNAEIVIIVYTFKNKGCEDITIVA